MATNPAKPDSGASILQPPSVKIREEGEISSSSDDEELSACSKERLSGLSNSGEAAVDKESLVVNGKETTAVKPLSPISSVDAIIVQDRSSLQSSKISVKNNPVSFGTSSTKWNAKSGANDDLVIVFSDDESDSFSESEEKNTTEVKEVVSSYESRKPGAPLEVKGAVSSYENRKPAATSEVKGAVSSYVSRKPVAPSSYLKVGPSQNAQTYKAKFQPNRGIFTRTFTSNQTCRPRLKDAARTNVKPISVTKNQNALESRGVNKFGKPKQGKCLDISELQDLRQKIAIRETEKKLQSSRKIREAIGDSSNTSINIHKRDRSRGMPSEYVQPEVTEPNKKRLKNGPNSYPSGVQSDISCPQKGQVLLYEHADIVHGVTERQKEPVEYDFSKGYKINSSEFGNSSVRSLLAVEEMHDKELEKSQKYRRQCEIEERNAHKMYREAQSALIEAVRKCNTLYRQRGQLSVLILSVLSGDVDSRLPSMMDKVPDATKVDTVGDKSLQEILEMDDSQENKLEEAQKYRHKCEINERKLLKAYRRTQLALIEASDRCSYLYFQRQQSATHANIDFYSRCHNQLESIAGDNVNTQPRVDFDVVQSPQYANQAHTDTNQVGYDSNFCSTSNVPATVSRQYMVGDNVGSETCSHPDTSSSEPSPLSENAGHLICSPNSNSDIVLDRDEQILLSNDTDRPCPPGTRCVEPIPSVAIKNGLDVDPHRTFCTDSDQAFLLQEAKLRSELRARLGKRPFSQKISSGIKSSQLSVGQAAETHINSEKLELSMSNVSLPQEEKSQLSFHGVHPDPNWNSQLSFRSAACSSQPVLRSTFSYIKNLNSTFCESTMVLFEYLSQNIGSFKGNDKLSEKTMSSDLDEYQVLPVNNIFSKQCEPYSCNPELDPFWPLCMYELRGKCNDDQCSWQHIKVRVNQKAPRLGSLACSFRQQFPISVASSRLLQRKMFDADLSGHVGNQWFQANESNRKLSYLQSLGSLAQLENKILDVDSSLETALVILSQEIDKFEGTDEALWLLSKAIEVDPKSSAVWIIYLLIYYSSRRSDENDDMILYAVKNNSRSYELWLLYINSRANFNSRLIAYDEALSALCSELSALKSESDTDTGSLILDIFLQLLEFLCVSGHVEKAIEKILELANLASTSDESHPLLSRLYSLLTIPDKCILWVSCVYLGVYKRLPEAVVIQFELKKELLEIDWPAVELIDYELQSAKKLLIAVEHIVDLCIDMDAVSRVSFSDLKSLHYFAVNHFRCKVILEGFDSGKLLAEKYIQLYPTCQELILLMARMHCNDLQDMSYSGFEEALCNWPKDVLGIHCIWNQYAAYALEKQRFDTASEVLSRWYETAYKCQPSECQHVYQVQDTPSDFLSGEDSMFKYLNLAIYHMLRGEHQEGKLAINNALEIAPSNLFEHCVIEHAFCHLVGMQPTDTSISSIVEILNGYMVDPRASTASCVLSWKFINNIKKPRVQKLISKFLAEISPDCAILNSVLESWFGTSLFPQNCTARKQLVNFVEAIMEIVPTNHQLAFHVLRQVGKDFDSKDLNASSLLFWASNLLVNSILEAVPVAPEYVWADAAELLGSSSSIQDISENFHEKAVTVYPFSIRIWKSYLNVSRVKDNSKTIIGRARDKGLEIE